MNAIKFIKNNGVDKAREVLSGVPETATHFTKALGGHYAKEGMLKMKPQWLWFNSINKEWYYDFAAEDHIHLPDLKRLVKSIDLVEFEGGLDKAKNVLFLKRALGLTPHADRLEQAIADYESIYGGK